MSRKIPNKTAKSREKPPMVVLTVGENSLEYNTKDSLLLYRTVYKGHLGIVAVLLLCLSFFVQSADLARASEVETSTDLVNEIVEPGLTGVNALVPDGDESDGGATDASDTESSGSDIAETEISNDEEDVNVEIDLSVEDESIDNTENTDATEDGLIEETETTDELSLSDEEDDIFIKPDSASTSDLTNEVVAVAYSDNSFSFNKNDCTELASGSFYCQKPSQNLLKDALFAATDTDGDLEIYMVKDGIEAKITDNQTDDAAPFYDQNSNSIVWHRLINDRYQIVSFDIETQEESVLTSTSENNMEPNRQGHYTVWQRWVDGGWNIILFDGDSERQITKTTSHNVAPYIHGTLVVWNRHDQVNDRTIEMYDLNTETYVSIEDPEGMSVSNPRMVFVYDSIHPNGDIVTKGYDMLAKKFIDLDTLPRSLPEELPESDGTGETRALIQNKPGGKTETEEVLGEDITSGIGEPIATTTQLVASTTSLGVELTLDLSTSVPVVEEPPIISPQDLVIEPISEALEILPESEQVVEFVIPE